MASTATLEEKFHAAVKAIQRLPNDGTFQPSNEMKLTFYGLYKQATVGPSQENRPSILNYVNRAKWDAWDKCRSMTKEAAMTAYIDEIRKILETMPQTDEVLEFTQLIGPFYEFVDDRAEQNGPITMKKNLNNSISSKSNLNEPLVNGNSDDFHHSKLPNGSSHVFVSNSNGPIPSSSPSSSSSSTISSSDVEEFYGDPSDRLPNNFDLPVEENVNVQLTSDPPSHVYGGQNGNKNPPTSRSHRHLHHHSTQSPSRSSQRHHGSSTGARNSPSSMISGAGGSGRYPNSSYNKETQRAILTALTKLQHDVNNILERLNRLETSAHFLQQREIVARQQSSNSIFRWLPLAGLRRRAVAFIVLWPFVVFALVRLFLRARIIIR